MHNIFIAIIQEGFASLKEKPVRKHKVDSSDSDIEQIIDPLPSKTNKKSPKQTDVKASKDALKMILKGESSSSSSIVVKNTQKAVAKIISFGKDADRLLLRMQMLANPQPGVNLSANQINDQLEITLKELKEKIDRILNNL